MRRQARISLGGVLVGRSASALQVWLWLLIYVFQNEFRISRSIEPGYLDFDNLPETNFTCAGKVIGGYYADLETSCQMFHVCTVGQQDEPMDIKFLCLNGTVFDQETRVCERVDEVDCTKSEKFYSLNLELYGSTLAPPVVQPKQQKPQSKPTEQTHSQTQPSKQEITDPSIDLSQSDKSHVILPEIEDTTEDPVIDTKKEDQHTNHHFPPTNPAFTSPEHEEVAEENEEEEEIDSENPEYEDDYAHSTTTTIAQIPNTTTSTTTKKPPITTIFTPTSTQRHPPSYLNNPSQSPPLSSLSPPVHSSSATSASSPQTLDPSLLSPQEFIYRHRGPGSEAISFQRQSFRPADGVFITHAPPHQYDHFQYESSRTAPRPVAPRPFVQKPQPFRPTTLDPRDQLLRPGPTSQSSERHEMSVKHKPQTYLPLPAQRPLPFDPFFYDRKRSDDSAPEDESTLAARSVAPPIGNKPKSPPRVIVTASASVSDSNGKRLNYTVGNVVSAVKPIVPINYDDYKESDLIFDPFFLDVPKLQKRRKTRSSKNRRVFIVPATATISSELSSEKNFVTTSPVTSRATTTESYPTTIPTTISTTTVGWSPDDYVDDNYEPHAYVQPVPPLAFFHYDRNKYSNKQETKHVKEINNKSNGEHVFKKVDNLEHVSGPTSSAAQTSSSQSRGGSASAPAPLPPPLEAPACAISGSADCRTRA